MSRIDKSIETESKIVVGYAEEIGVRVCGQRVQSFFLGDKRNILKLIVVTFVQLCDMNM